jgi:hypothetical protein
MGRIETPAILPSGITVDKSVAEELINNNSWDPYDRTKRCRELSTVSANIL